MVVLLSLGSDGAFLSSELPFYIKMKNKFGTLFVYTGVITVALGLQGCSQLTLAV